MYTKQNINSCDTVLYIVTAVILKTKIKLNAIDTSINYVYFCLLKPIYRFFLFNISQRN